MCRSKNVNCHSIKMDPLRTCGSHCPVVTWLSVDRQLSMREYIPAKLEEGPSPLAAGPTAAAAVVVEEQGENVASWWFEHANSLVNSWRREQYPDHGTADSLGINVELRKYLVYDVRCGRLSELPCQYICCTCEYRDENNGRLPPLV